MARRPRKADPSQLDLFAPRTGQPASAAAEPRGSADGEPLPGFSGERGTFGLSAAESARVLSCLSIAHTGYRFADGASCCRACFPVWSAAGNDRGRGYRMAVYRSRDPLLLARCVACGVPFPGETAQEEMDHRHKPPRGPSLQKAQAQA